MPVDPELQLLVDLVGSADEIDPWEAGPQALRAAFEALVPLFGARRGDVVVDELVVDGRDGPLRVRRYVPAGGSSGAGLVWFHGGGWVIGSLDSHDVLCADLAAAARATVLSVDYRLAPEHPYPAAVHDAVDATIAVATGASGTGVDPSRLAVGGDSAGAHLATVVARRLRDLGGPTVAAQVLVYPVTDLAAGADDHASRRSNESGYVLTTRTVDYFAAQFVPDADRRGDAEVSPLRCTDLSGLPPALVLTAEYDPLRDEGEAYAAAMARAGVHVVADRYDGAIHLFLQLSTTQAGRRAVDQIGSFLAERV